MAQFNDNTIRYEEEFISNSRGMKLFTCRWLPQEQEPKALIFLCHGYAVECSIFMRDTGIRLAKAGYAVYGIDYEGHGKSSGLQTYIPNFDDLVDDCSSYFVSICEKPEYNKLQRFLFGESMGGAVLLLLHRKLPTYWHGAVLVAPMCKIADDLKPHPIVISMLKGLAHIIPKWRIVPIQDLADVTFKLPEKRQEVRSNLYAYGGKPRLQTANELLRVSLDIEKRLHEVTIPFLIVHGGDDKVTDPTISKLLYESATSKDKTFNLYPGMWHALIFGEPVKNINLVFSDIQAWLDHRASSDTSEIEGEQKAMHDVNASVSQTK